MSKNNSNIEHMTPFDIVNKISERPIHELKELARLSKARLHSLTTKKKMSSPTYNS